MTYTVTETWLREDEAISVCHSTDKPLVFSEAGVALQKTGWTFKERTWHPAVSKNEIIERSVNAISERGEAISGN